MKNCNNDQFDDCNKNYYYNPCQPMPVALTITSMGAQNTCAPEICVYDHGTTIALPNNQILDSFCVDSSDKTFTVPKGGTYLITYEINLTSCVPVYARILCNGEKLDGSDLHPKSTISAYYNTQVAKLCAGDKLQLQLYGCTAAVCLNEGVGACLTIVRIA